jgi:hypothetical protein
VSHPSQTYPDTSSIDHPSAQANPLQPTHIHPSIELTIPTNTLPVLSDPTTHLSLPELLPTTTPLLKMSNNNYVIPPLAQMPIKGSKNAPETFKGGYKHVTPFIDRYNHLLEYYHGTSDEDKCRGILEYCSQSVKDFIQINPYFLAPNWAKLQDEILNAYDAERMNFRICSRDFFDFVGQSHKSQIVNLSQWKRYHREYIAKAGFLKQNG